MSTDRAWRNTDLALAPPAANPRPSRPPSVVEAAQIEAAKVHELPTRVGVQARRDSHGRRVLCAPHTDEEGHGRALGRSLGSSSSDFVAAELDLLGRAVNLGHPFGSEQGLNAGLAMVGAAEPRNELETALAVNAAASHHQAMRLLAKIEQVDGAPYAAAAYGTAAARLMRACADQLLALDRLRRKADQRIVVEHLHLEPGARAVFNQIGVAEGRGPHKPGEQAHASIKGRASGLADVGAAVWGENAVGNSVPQPEREREEALPHARRQRR